MKNLKYLVVFTLLASVVLAACQPVRPVDATPENGYEFGEEAIVESVVVLLLESLPALGDAIVTGYLPDGCTELYEINIERQDQEFILTVVTRRETGDVMCTMALEPFEKAVDLDIIGLEAGTYTVIAQDQQTEFTLFVDNVYQEDPVGDEEDRVGDQENRVGGQDDPINDQDDLLFISDGYVEGLSIDILESYPVQVRVNLSGHLPDGCTKIREIRSSRDGNTFTIQVITKTLGGDVMCTMALVPFQESIDLEVEGLPAGKYTVRYGGLSASFTLDTDN